MNRNSAKIQIQKDRPSSKVRLKSFKARLVGVARAPFSIIPYRGSAEGRTREGDGCTYTHVTLA